LRTLTSVVILNVETEDGLLDGKDVGGGAVIKRVVFSMKSMFRTRVEGSG